MVKKSFARFFIPTHEEHEHTLQLFKDHDADITMVEEDMGRARAASLVPDSQGTAIWCWKESLHCITMHHKSAMYGNPYEGWIKYDDHANSVLESAFQLQGASGSEYPSVGYMVNFATMKQTNMSTGFQRKVKRVVVKDTRKKSVDTSQTSLRQRFANWKKKRNRQDDNFDSIPAEWKKLIENCWAYMENCNIGTIKKWLAHQNKQGFIDWKDDSIANGMTMLHCAILYGRLDIVKLLLEHGADFSIANKFGTTVLMRASWNGQSEIVKLLLDKDADYNIANRKGETALIIASFKGHEEVAKLLLDKGANWKLTNKDGDTALDIAHKEEHNEIVELLLSVVGGSEIPVEWLRLFDSDEMNKVDIATFVKQWLSHPQKDRFINWKDESYENGMTMLHCAIKYKRWDVAIMLLEHDADVNVADKTGTTALILASIRGHSELGKLLLEKGALVNAVDKSGWTALMFGCRSGHIKIVELLLEMGSDITVSDTYGMNALMLASRDGHTKTVEHLLHSRADINVANKYGMTALMLSSRQGHTATVKLLMENGAAVSIVNNDGDTAMSLASNEGHTEIVDLVLQHDHFFILEKWKNVIGLEIKKIGIETLEKWLEHPKKDHFIDCKDDGRTMLSCAIMYARWDIAALLLRHGADCNIVDKKGNTALMWATRRGHADTVKLLLDKGVDCNMANEKGNTPLIFASRLGHTKIVELLMVQGADIRIANNQGRTAFTEAYFASQTEVVDLLLEKALLNDIIHEVVKYPSFADNFFALYKENRDIVNWRDKDGRTVRQVACKECREAILFLGRYDLDIRPKYESPTCKIHAALDYGGRDVPNLKQPSRVAIKFMEKKEHFLNEIRSRRNDDGTQRFSSDFVTPDLAAYSADEDPEYAEACRIWNFINGKTGMLPDHCIVMPLGERSLLESLNAENLSAKHKDLQRREILLTLCQIFGSLHGMGYVHGDVKPHNVVRHTGETVTWKAIDFDSCTKTGEAVGLKLTTGSAPPEILKIVKEDNGKLDQQRVILRQPGRGLDESELLLADPSFDVWSYGILMYQLVTGRSFFHCDLQGNIDEAGLQELANLNEDRINKKLDGVEDVNARVLLSRILRLDPKERPTMREIGNDYYFHPSESPQGRQSDFFSKRVSDSKSQDPSACLGAKTTMRKRKGEDDGLESTQEIERFLSSKSEFSYFKLRDEDKDWSDKLLNSEIETFHFDKLGGMGDKPKLIDGDAIYNSDFLRSLLSSKGPDYFMGFLVEYFELYEIMSDAHEVCHGIQANLVSDVKDLKGIFIKLFVRGKGLNDAVRGTLFCNSIDQFKYVGRLLHERYGYNVYIKPPKSEVGAWPIPKLLVYGSRRFEGRCMSVEIQFSTVYMHLAIHASNNHLVYEAIRESTGYLGDKDEKFQEFLQSLNEQYIDTEGFLRNQSAEEGCFEIVAEQTDGKDVGDTNSNESNLHQYATRATGFISSGRICCGDIRFHFMSPADRFQRFSESSFVVNKCLTLLSSHSYWSEELYDLEGKSVEFLVSFKGRGLAIAGLGTAKCLHGTTERNGGGTRCSVHIGRSKLVIRRSGDEIEEFQAKKLPDEEKAKIIFKMKNGVLFVLIVGSDREANEEIGSLEVAMPRCQKYHLYMRAPPGVHSVKFHEVNISDGPIWV